MGVVGRLQDLCTVSRESLSHDKDLSLCCVPSSSSLAKELARNRMGSVPLKFTRQVVWVLLTTWLAQHTHALPYDLAPDNIPRDMYCLCQEYDCNCAYRTICEESAATVLTWENDETHTCSRASYKGKCYCHKECLCDIDKIGMAEDAPKVPYTHSDGSG